MSHSTTRRNRHSYMARPTRRTKQPILIPVAGTSYDLCPRTARSAEDETNPQRAFVLLGAVSHSTGEEDALHRLAEARPAFLEHGRTLQQRQRQVQLLVHEAA